ncbi:ABC transporter ATP-binding protein [Chitinimonas taiwanensis]|jgi:multiple sugar transport system ATP-binding protein|uniref:Multiple sugar transport system ATP-binding protein n=1 Tax=Chitinimonas taiwanensis DSM 18899 TaxID=1121279 RepID=A0A1K2HH25_9NEIS|nr:sn-glycerol-3-phosphate ABC transporter ATP-binding protein UgpC [Chitinimonas taiwanensis]SFZ75801.1 multiple sugar transport system ATP-binding protein [Chitinimonas taiwanensis DSM 18899]
MGALSIRNVKKSYGDTHILKGIDLEIDKGQFLILVGPSGCGKSTLLNMIAGLDDISSGEIAIADRVVNKLSPKDRDIAMVFQSYALYPNMSVKKNIAFGLEIRKVPKAEQEEIIARVAKTLQIEHLLDRKPSQLSGGQRQRVAMGRALARNPTLFLFDEPLSNLDAKLRVEMRTEIKLLHQRLGTTIVYVTHDQIEAMTLGDRIAVMKDGEVKQFGSPQEIYDTPANLYVAGFIGSPAMNFIPVQLGEEGGHAVVVLDNGSTPQSVRLGPISEAQRAFVGKQVILGVRPEQLTDPESAHSDRTNLQSLQATVAITEPTGPDTLVTVTLNGVKTVARCHPRAAGHPGQAVTLVLDPTKALLFDPASEKRLA